MRGAPRNPTLWQSRASFAERDQRILKAVIIDGRSLQSVGEEHGVSRQRVNQIVKRMVGAVSLRSKTPTIIDCPACGQFEVPRSSSPWKDHLKEAGHPPSTRKGLAQKARIVQMYRSGMSGPQIASALGWSEAQASKVYPALHQMGEPVRGYSQPRARYRRITTEDLALMERCIRSGASVGQAARAMDRTIRAIQKPYIAMKKDIDDKKDTSDGAPAERDGGARPKDAGVPTSDIGAATHAREVRAL